MQFCLLPCVLLTSISAFCFRPFCSLLFLLCFYILTLLLVIGGSLILLTFFPGCRSGLPLSGVIFFSSFLLSCHFVLYCFSLLVLYIVGSSPIGSDIPDCCFDFGFFPFFHIFCCPPPFFVVILIKLLSDLCLKSCIVSLS